MKKFKLFLTIAFAYISIVGIITFSLFIHEEAVQTIMFGTWPAKNINRWDIVMEGADLMRKTNRSAKIINYSIGWIQPLAFFSYRAYSKATDFYIKSIEAESFANSPELFIGRKVEFTFYPKQIMPIEDGRWMAINGKLSVISNTQLPLDKMQIKGELIKYKNHLTVIQ
jgi:hypothetical protein